MAGSTGLGHFVDETILITVRENPFHLLEVTALLAFLPEFLPAPAVVVGEAGLLRKSHGLFAGIGHHQHLAAPVGIFLINIRRGNRAPLMYLFFGFPVRGAEIQKEWGFVMEDFGETNGSVSRKFIGFSDSVRRMLAGEGRIYTKDLREHPEDFAEELATYRKAGSVWISYAVPFIIPITAGFVTAVVFGDFLFAIIKIFTGA